MPMDAIELLLHQHNEIRGLFNQYQQMQASASPQQKRELTKKIIEKLMVHTYLENKCMYPMTRTLCPDLNSEVLESYQEHHVADVLAAELAELSPEDERYDAKMTVLMESILHHLQEEEQVLFPRARSCIDAQQLQEMGAQMAALEAEAPRAPSSALKKAVAAMSV